MSKSPRVVYWLGNSIYLNITNRCHNNCYFCLRRFKEGIQEFSLKLREEPSLNDVIKELQEVASRKNWSGVVFCGFGEPLERLDHVLKVTKWVKKHSKKDIRVDTNGQGYLLNKGREVVMELKETGVDKTSVSLNAHDKVTYNHVCKPEFENAFESVLEFIQKSKKENLGTEITTVTIPEVKLSKVRELANRMKVEFRVRDYIQCFW